MAQNEKTFLLMFVDFYEGVQHKTQVHHREHEVKQLTQLTFHFTRLVLIMTLKL